MVITHGQHMGGCRCPRKARRKLSGNSFLWRAFACHLGKRKERKRRKSERRLNGKGDEFARVPRGRSDRHIRRRCVPEGHKSK
ncbi:hypothetical protein AVEN_152871-1 [Araneus ventricosus]|uniref:Uncharacterized protein n=1 Tax=Araneus ventricosus TaxID=182803 RepID=A0A4Y2AD68_ARAVE|nr:hypothetical protein AVEN_152871-1 [Araneus ventricosus]